MMRNPEESSNMYSHLYVRVAANILMAFSRPDIILYGSFVASLTELTHIYPRCASVGQGRIFCRVPDMINTGICTARPHGLIGRRAAWHGAMGWAAEA